MKNKDKNTKSTDNLSHVNSRFNEENRMKTDTKSVLSNANVKRFNEALGD